MSNTRIASSLTSPALRDNDYDTVHNRVAPALMPCRRPTLLRIIAITGVLFAIAMGAFAQTQQLSGGNTADGGAAGSIAAVETRPATAASQNAQSQAQSAAGLSKEIANPLSNLWLLQLQQNNTLVEMPFSDGTDVQSGLQFQPLVPIHLNDHWNLISRPVIPVFSSQPYPAIISTDAESNTVSTDVKRDTGFGDMIFATAISPDRSLVGNWLLAAGATFIFPTATERTLGQHTWQAGPTVALGYMGDKWLAFVFPQQWWKIGGDGKETNQTSVQYNFGWNFNSGWSVGTSPSFFVNWEAPRDQRVSFPVGLQVGKLLHAGRMPVKVELQPEYYAVRPTVTSGGGAPSPKWDFQLQVTPVIPSLIHGHNPS